MTSEIKNLDTSLEDEKVLTEHIEVAHAVTRDDMEKGRTKRTVNTQLDDAAKLLEEAGGHVEYTHADNKRILRLIDFYVCLPMCLVYFIQQVGCLSKMLAMRNLTRISRSSTKQVSVTLQSSICKQRPTWLALSTVGSPASCKPQ